VTGYSEDRVRWSEEQGRLLREHRLDALDRDNVGAKIGQLGVEDIGELRERIRILVTTLLRWAYQVDLRSTGLASTITAQRGRIESLLEDSASQRSIVDDLVIETYPEAKRMAVVESGLFDERFPEGLPFLPSEVFDLYFFPDPHGEDEGRPDAWWRDRRGSSKEKA
jgi:hypothetical protein